MSDQKINLRLLKYAVWAVLACLIFFPIGIASINPLLGYRELVYVIGGMAGITALAVLLIQPLLAGNYLPGVNNKQARLLHRWLGSALILMVILHVGGLYLASPMDALDALLLIAPTPFSVYGVIGMWAVIVTAVLVALRTRLPIRYATWRVIHNTVAVVIAVTTVVHALMIEGAMGSISKLVLCTCVLLATGITILHQRIIKPLLEKK